MKPKVAAVIIAGLLAAVNLADTAKACLVTDAVQPTDGICTIEEYLPKQQATALLQEWTAETIRMMRYRLISQAGRYSEVMLQHENTSFVFACTGANIGAPKFAKAKSSQQDILMVIRMAYDKKVIPQSLWMNIHSQSI